MSRQIRIFHLEFSTPLSLCVLKNDCVVTVHGLAPSGNNTSLQTMIIKFRSCIYTAPALDGSMREGTWSRQWYYDVRLKCKAPVRGLSVQGINLPWCYLLHSLIARFMGPIRGPSGADRTHVGPILAPWTLLSGYSAIRIARIQPHQRRRNQRVNNLFTSVQHCLRKDCNMVYVIFICVIWFIWQRNHCPVSMVFADSLKPNWHQGVYKNNDDTDRLGYIRWTTIHKV